MRHSTTWVGTNWKLEPRKSFSGWGSARGIFKDPLSSLAAAGRCGLAWHGFFFPTRISFFEKSQGLLDRFTDVGVRVCRGFPKSRHSPWISYLAQEFGRISAQRRLFVEEKPR